MSKIWTKKSKMRKIKNLRGLKRVKWSLKRGRCGKLWNQGAKKSKMNIKMENQIFWASMGLKRVKWSLKRGKCEKL